MIDRATCPLPDGDRGGTVASAFDVRDGGTASPADRRAPPTVDPSAALFAVMRSTFWATGEEFLQRLVSSLGIVLDGRVVLAESVTGRARPPEEALGLWIAEGAEAFRYAAAPSPTRPGYDEDAVTVAVVRALAWEGALRGIPVRSPSGRPFGQLLVSAGATPGRFGVTLMDAVLLSPLAARAGAELARLQAGREPCVASALVHICAWCKGVRDARHTWSPVEDFIRSLTDAAFTHGICPDCSRRV